MDLCELLPEPTQGAALFASALSVRPSEPGALALFALGRVSASGDGGVALALKVIRNRIVENLRRCGVVLVIQVAPDGVTQDHGCGGVVLDLEVAADGVAGTRRRVI